MKPVFRTKLAGELRVGDKFHLEENGEVILHEVVQAYSKRKFSGERRVIKTDQGASLELKPDFEVEIE